MNSREAAFLALLASIRHEQFIIHSLQIWKQQEKPTQLDFAFAYEIASGASRMALALDYIGSQLSKNKKLHLKMKERVLLRTAVYQYCFMEKVPLYAIVNETIEIAKRYCHKTFVSFLNALLRQLEVNQHLLPLGDNVAALSIRYSYPVNFIELLIGNYGKKKAEELLRIGNIQPKLMARVRPGIDLNQEAFKFLNVQHDFGVPIAILEKAASLSALVQLPEIYIQNATPVALIAFLAEHTQQPLKILDLCASPGGKLLAAHDVYPQAKLYANDVSIEKIVKLSQNLSKYGVKADLTCGQGECYQSKELFDLIILDVPCSNSGVLNKRPEARWRLTKDAINQLKTTQLLLIEHAATLLNAGGVIWYLTCSILKEENEEILKSLPKNFGLHLSDMRTILPNGEGWDGGFAALLTQLPKNG